jgi:hypothetical protein
MPTADSSVAGSQLSATCDAVTLSTRRFVGAAGAIVSRGVSTISWSPNDLFPAASIATTER